jgi:hypothetical protein
MASITGIPPLRRQEINTSSVRLTHTFLAGLEKCESVSRNEVKDEVEMTGAMSGTGKDEQIRARLTRLLLSQCSGHVSVV